MTTSTRKISRNRGAQSGQAIVLIALAMIVLLLFVGLAIDGNRVFELKRRLQNAADSASMAASYKRCADQWYAEQQGWDGKDTTSDSYFTANSNALLYLLGDENTTNSWKYDAKQAAITVATNNGFTTGGNISVSFKDPTTDSGAPQTDPLGGSGADPNYVQVIISSQIDGSPLSKLIYRGVLAAEARATAHCSLFIPPDIFKNAAMAGLCLSGSQCPGNSKNAVQVSGNGALTIQNGNLVANAGLDNSGNSVNITNNNATIVLSGTRPDGGTPDIVTGGGTVGDCSQITNPTSHSPGCATTSATTQTTNPWAGFIPVPPKNGTCINASSLSGAIVLHGGHCYTGSLAMHNGDSVTCDDGTSVGDGISGPYLYWTNGSISGNGDSSFNCSGIAAFTDGTKSGGLYIYFDSGSTSVSLQGSGALKWYAPYVPSGSSYTTSYNGLAYFQNNSYSNSTADDWEGATLDMHGTFYVPNNDIKLNGNSTSTVKAQFICNTLEDAGNAALTVIYEPDLYYTPPPTNNQNY